jgi:dienelactone hydrolase
MPDPVMPAEFRAEQKTFGGVTKTVYRIGARGPGVVLMHEIPGVTPNVLRLAKIVAGAGYRVAVPSLFGHDAKPADPLYSTEVIMAMCVSREFAVFAADGSSPVVDWLRALCVDLYGEAGEGKGVGAIGLCITGGFALSLAVGANGVVKAPVMSEPSLPFHLPFTRNDAAVHLTPDEQRELAGSSVRAVGLRFTNDSLCKKERFDRYEAILGAPRFDRIEIMSPDAGHGIGGDAHSVLTTELSDDPNHPTNKALHSVLSFLAANL